MTDLLKNLPKIRITPKVYKDLPETAGIYVFFKDLLPIYIGKAINLKRRVSSYFEFNLEPKTSRMVKDAQNLSFIQVNSELEALILEAKLIRLYLPKYNIAAKDDKHPLYIQITKEKYPRIITVRKIAENQKSIAFYGPFPSTRNVQAVLKMIRRIFPFSDHKLGKRGCLYSHIGLCNPCPSIIERITDKSQKVNERTKYLKNIRNIKYILDGNIRKLQKNLIKEMSDASKNQDYETATEVRDRLQRIEYITRPQMPTEFYMQNPNLYEDIRISELKEFKKMLTDHKLDIKNLKRIECFDVAHLAGTKATASMVTFNKGEPDKSYYRHFRIRQAKSSSDIDSLKEVITRRLNHIKDWGKPDLIIVDGGVAQVNTFNKVIINYKSNIPVIGIAKNPDRLIVADKKLLLRGSSLHFVSRMRDEAHRFARRYHHQLISNALTINDL
jgi:excinuclease ABC subunit C